MSYWRLCWCSLWKFTRGKISRRLQYISILFSNLICDTNLKRARSVKLGTLLMQSCFPTEEVWCKLLNQPSRFVASVSRVGACIQWNIWHYSSQLNTKNINSRQGLLFNRHKFYTGKKISMGIFFIDSLRGKHVSTQWRPNQDRPKTSQ